MSDSPDRGEKEKETRIGHGKSPRSDQENAGSKEEDDAVQETMDILGKLGIEHPKKRAKKRKKKYTRSPIPGGQGDNFFVGSMPPPKIASSHTPQGGSETEADNELNDLIAGNSRSDRFTTGGSTTTGASEFSDSTAETSKFVGRNGARFDRADVQKMMKNKDKKGKKEDDVDYDALRSKHKVKKKRRKKTQHAKDAERMEISANPGFTKSFFKRLPRYSAGYKGAVAVQPPPSDPEDQVTTAPRNIPFFRKSIKTPGTDLGAYEKDIIPESVEKLKAEQEEEEEARRVKYRAEKEEKKQKQRKKCFMILALLLLLVGGIGGGVALASPPAASSRSGFTASPTTATPSISPTTMFPTVSPTISPTRNPTSSPTPSPTAFPTTEAPTTFPTKAPTPFPTTPAPTSFPTTRSPTSFPTNSPTSFPTTTSPTSFPTTASPTPFPSA